MTHVHFTPPPVTTPSCFVTCELRCTLHLRKRVFRWDPHSAPRDDLFQFCLTIAGDTPSSNWLFDAIASHCVPVIISYDIELPFEDVLDYSKFAIFVQSSDAVKKGYLMKLLRGIKRQKWIQMWERLKKIALHFEYQYPSQAGDAVDMIWQAVHRKISKYVLYMKMVFVGEIDTGCHKGL
ncbi:putative xylogalacturonan beta-1,3-xylosyltransferase [Helianthus anomalus]